MIFSRIAARRWRHALAGAVTLAALVACGGGTSQYQTFVAGRVIAIGDETSALTSDGRKYSTNGTTASTDASGTTVHTLDCQAQPNWVQALAGLYGYVFAECNPARVETPKAIMRAQPGARVEDIQVQIDAQIAAGGFRDKDLVALLAGANDIVELYQQYPGRSEADIAAEVRRRGKALALQANRIVDYGAKVIISTVPDMGLSPYALKQRLEFSDINRADLLSRLTAAFNEQLGVNILLDGRFVGLVQADLSVQAMSKSPGSYGLSNASTAVCLETAPLPECNDQTLVENGSAGGWLWADDLRLAYGGQAQIGSLAINRARRNPF
ncbi:MAG: esterase [Rubrivivax sp.]